ncbi:MAG: ABC transporter, partial [Actinomycetota bacterium]|nr:ABC transporter [Actinomycetota bacterium]
VDAMRAAARPGDDDLADALDRAVTATPLPLDRRPLWWTFLGLLQWLLLALSIVGLAWLAAIFAVNWLGLPDLPEAPGLGVVPLPTALFLGGILASLLVAALGRVMARAGGRRRAAIARRRLHDAVATVADQCVLTPLQAEGERHRRLREQLALARAS